MAVMLLLVPAAARAGACTMSVLPVGFGAYDPFTGLPATSVGRVAWSCTGTGNGRKLPLITLGAGSSGTVAQRTLRQGAEALRYNLFKDPTYSLVWGDGITGSGLDSDAPQGQATIYGFIPGGQDVASGAYTDTVVVGWQF